MNQVLTLLNVDKSNEAKVEKVKILFGYIEQALLNMIGEEVVPLELEWIVNECVIQRYGMLGSESVTSEGLDGISYSYKDINSLLDGYKQYINQYISNKKPELSKKKMWMI